MNTVLAPATYDTSEPDYRAMFQPAQLVYVDPGLAVRGFSLDPTAVRESASPSSFGRGALPFFHCEVEGTKLDSWTTALIAYLWTLFALATAALVLAGIVTALGPIAWVLWIAIALLILLAALFRPVAGRRRDRQCARRSDRGRDTRAGGSDHYRRWRQRRQSRRLRCAYRSARLRHRPQSALLGRATPGQGHCEDPGIRIQPSRGHAHGR